VLIPLALGAAVIGFVVVMYGARVMDARATSRGGGVRLETGSIDGSTGIAVNRRSILGNQNLARYVHRLVDVVLLPVHRNGAFAKVRISRQ
jgi:hypothetical protein